MKRISSRDNPFFKTLRTLSGSSTARRDAGVALLEGVHLADAYLASGGMPKQVVIGESALPNAEIAGLLDRLGGGPSGPEHLVLDDALFGAVSQLGHGVPLLMVIERPRPARPAQVTRASVALDRVQDPGNVGSILRSGAAAGILDIYLSRDCAAAWSPKVLRAGMGAHFHLTLFEDCDLPALKRDSSIPWFATSPHARRDLYDADLRGDVVWAFGHEGQGLDTALTDAATLVRIPQPGHGESLNVAASAAVCFFEQVRQRRFA